MAVLDSYYNQRWDSEDKLDRPPAPTRVRLVAETVAAIASGSQPSILDVGCGNGWILAAIDERLAGRGRLSGVEPSPLGAENCAQRVPTANISTGTLGSVRFEEKFDVVVSSEVIEHVPDQLEFVSQIAAVLKPDGVLVLSTPNGLYRESYFRDNAECEPQPVENWLDVSELRELCAADYMVQSIRTFDPEYFYQRHSALAMARKVTQALPGGRHVRCRLDRLVWREMKRGLNILAVLERRPDDSSSAV